MQILETRKGKIMTKPTQETPVYFIKDAEICESTLGDLCSEYADTTTSPLGVAHRMHLRGNELWTWGTGGQCPRLVYTYDTLEEAEEGLFESFLYDLENHCDSPVYYFERRGAEARLAELEEE